ncbi:MAG: HD domain-containing phosphohydrolase [Planctomycetota bacterium]
MISLIGLEGPVAGKRFFLKAFPFQIGRGPKNDLVLNDSHVSLQHAVVVQESDGVFVVDLGSTNGTVVNGKASGRALLGDGDTIAIGSSEFRVISGGFTTSKLSRRPAKAQTGLQRDETKTFATLKGLDHTIFLRPQEDMALLRKSHEALRILYGADSIMADVRDLEATLGKVIDLVMEVFGAERAFLMLIDPESGELRFETQRPRDAEIAVSATISAKVLQDHESVLSWDAMSDPRFAAAQSIMKQRVRSVVCAPLKSADRVLGMIYADISSQTKRYDEDDLKLLTAIGYKAGVGVENALLYRDIQSLFLGAIETIIDAIRAKDVYTRGHSERVRNYSVMIGKAIGLDAKQMQTLTLAAVLHDVGKIGMPDRLLYNKDALSPEEYEEIKVHAAQGAELLSRIDRLKDVVPVVRHHHEALDGSGYPDGLKGDEIPLPSRIIAVADTYDACTTDRPYQKGMPREKAVEILRKLSGARLDAALVDAFIKTLSQQTAPSDDSRN